MAQQLTSTVHKVHRSGTVVHWDRKFKRFCGPLVRFNPLRDGDYLGSVRALSRDMNLSLCTHNPDLVLRLCTETEGGSAYARYVCLAVLITAELEGDYSTNICSVRVQACCLPSSPVCSPSYHPTKISHNFCCCCYFTLLLFEPKTKPNPRPPPTSTFTFTYKLTCRRDVRDFLSFKRQQDPS